MNNHTVSERLTTRMMIGYGSGEFAVSLVINCVGFYLLYYFTDVFLISPVMAGTIILVSRLVQSFMNPVAGILSDRTETRWGKKRPFLLFAAIPLGFFFFLLFSPAGLVSVHREACAFTTSILFLVAFSFVGIPYSSLTSVITHDSHERSLLSGWRMSFGLLASFVAAGFTRPIAAQFRNEAIGFRYTSLLYGLLVVIILFITFNSITERNISATSTARTPILNSFLLIWKNGPFLIISLASLFFFMAMNTLAATINYYFKYVLNAENMISVAFVSLFAAAGFSIPFLIAAAKKWGKKKAFMASTAFLSLVLSVNYVLGVRGVPFTLSVLALAGVGIAGIFLFPWSLMPDTVEYMQWKTGHRHEGMLYGFFVLFFNLSAAFSGLLTGLGLDLAGYAPNSVQTPGAINGIFILMTIVPALCIMAGTLLLRFYPIDEAMHNRIVSEIRNGNI